MRLLLDDISFLWELIFPMAISLALVSIYYIMVRRSESKEKADKPLIELGKKEVQERQRKLAPFMVPRTLLYIDNEQFDSLYSQSQLKNTGMKTETLTKTSTIEISHGVDAKLLSSEGRRTQSEERILRQRTNTDVKYLSILEWLCGTDSLIMGLENMVLVSDEKSARERVETLKTRLFQLIDQPSETCEQLDKELEKIFLDFANKYDIQKLKSVKNKYVALIGNCTIRPFDSIGFRLKLENSYNVFIEGPRDHCTKTGTRIFSTEGTIRTGIIGFISDVNEELFALLVEPLVIYRFPK